MANGRGGGANSARKKGGRRGQLRSTGPRSAAGTADAGAVDTSDVGAADDQTDQYAQMAAAQIASTNSSGKQAQMVFTVGTFDDDEHMGAAMLTSGATSRQGLPVNAVAHHASAHVARKPLFTMGSHSEMSDIDGPDVSSMPPTRPLARTGGNLANLRLADAVHDPPSQAHGHHSSSLDTEDSVPVDLGGPRARDSLERLELAVARSPSQLHACKATTGLSRLGVSSHSYSESISDSDSSDSGSALAVCETRVISAPAGATNADTTSMSEQAQRGKAKAGPMRDVHAKPRKKVASKKPTASKKPHVKKAASSAALRTRLRQGTVLRRDTHASKLQSLDNNGHGDSSYVDYSGNSDIEDASGVATQAARVVAVDQPRGSLHSSTATLGDAGQDSQDIDESVTTASIDSPRFEQQTEAQTEHVAAYHHGADHSNASVPDGGMSEEHPATSEPSQSQPSQGYSYGRRSSEDAEQGRGRSLQTRAPEQRRTSEEPSPGATYMAKNIKRNMESQRQQSIVEKEEEDMEITCSLLTGVPRRCNRPASMAPQVFLAPDSPAYSQQVRRTERAYAHVRAMAHPLLESISRCVELREQRAAMNASREQAWTPRRPPIAPRQDARAEWWESLLPPPLSQQPSREPRGAPAFSRLQQTELPRWVQKPDDAKCAVYSSDLSPAHDRTDPSCSHIRELRVRANDLRFMRQHTLTAGKASGAAMRAHVTSNAAHETWHGRRVPGLLNVKTFASQTAPLSLGAHTSAPSDADTLASSSPDSALLSRSNHLVPPYRRYGTVYGNTSTNAANALPANTAGYTGTAAVGTNTNSAHGAPTVALRRHDSIQSNRPATASIYENDPRRSSYLDRLSIDEDHQQLASAAAQSTQGGFLRRVFSGLTGGTTTFGSSQ
ncbi:hypothetical protein GGH12_003163 [Coemansia sp. RSA 1822]|nr:hypothetical protein LPJ76_002936 [Coemansia sp. RSA 638]KAJ2542398.1 hypothetical protein GGF49_002883 [Coemansia sp. RSA 1853]KAJ2562547.1 hypothetical protein GGH12_003163 [Coemansia sp. RSA 1822]